VRGGWTGAPNRFTVVRDGNEIEPSAMPGKITGFALRAGDIVVERTAGGGGYGDPLERDAQAIERDVRFGYVSTESAQAAYGAHAAAQRIVLRVLPGTATAHTGGRLIVRIARSSADRLAAASGELVEVARADGPSLLAWTEVADVPDDACAFANEADSVLGLTRDERVTLRRVRDAR
jgi:hypothetical protein